jgi:hypothetical protein
MASEDGATDVAKGVVIFDVARVKWCVSGPNPHGLHGWPLRNERHGTKLPSSFPPELGYRLSELQGTATPASVIGRDEYCIQLPVSASAFTVTVSDDKPAKCPSENKEQKK